MLLKSISAVARILQFFSYAQVANHFFE